MSEADERGYMYRLVIYGPDAFHVGPYPSYEAAASQAYDLWSKAEVDAIEVYEGDIMVDNISNELEH